MSIANRKSPFTIARSLLILTQVYPPDPAALGQYVADVAAAMAARGWRVAVLTSACGYENPALRYPSDEMHAGARVRRFAFSSFGKRNFRGRVLGGLAFLAQATLVAALNERPDAILVSTSPPFAPAAGLLLARSRGIPIIHWAMDINPDQAVALGRARTGSPLVRAMDAMNRAILRDAAAVITLDEAMAERLRRKHDPGDRLVVVPPWPLVPVLTTPRRPTIAPSPDAEAFRASHGLAAKFVVMYSGNLGQASPVDTLLDAALALRARGDDAIRFVFIGGGSLMSTVREFADRHALTSVVTLGYRPLAELPDTLAAADVHAVSMHDEMPGICHPSKTYSALAVGSPIVFIGAEHAPPWRLIARHNAGWRIAHSDTLALVSALREASSHEAIFAAKSRGALNAALVLNTNTPRDSVCDTITRAATHGLHG